MRLLRYILIAGIALVFSKPANATFQREDNLIYESDHATIGHPFFLEKYFDSGNKKPKLFTEEGINSTGCYRGYVATWKIQNDRLYLVKLEKEYSKTGKNQLWNTEWRTIPLTVVFPDATNSVFAYWASRSIRVPQGKKLLFEHCGAGSDHERDLYLTLKNGIVVAKREIDNTAPNALRSKEDIKWTAAASTIGDNRFWEDARIVSTDDFFENEADAQYPFSTRGLFRPANASGYANLVVPETRLTPFVLLTLKTIPDDFSGTNNMPVEVEAKFELIGKHRALSVESIRPLKPGESIHHPRFILPMMEINP